MYDEGWSLPPELINLIFEYVYETPNTCTHIYDAEDKTVFQILETDDKIICVGKEYVRVWQFRNSKLYRTYHEKMEKTITSAILLKKNILVLAIENYIKIINVQHGDDMKINHWTYKVGVMNVNILLGLRDGRLAVNEYGMSEVLLLQEDIPAKNYDIKMINCYGSGHINCLVDNGLLVTSTDQGVIGAWDYIHNQPYHKSSKHLGVYALTTQGEKLISISETCVGIWVDFAVIEKIPLNTKVGRLVNLGNCFAHYSATLRLFTSDFKEWLDKIPLTQQCAAMLPDQKILVCAKEQPLATYLIGNTVREDIFRPNSGIKAILVLKDSRIVGVDEMGDMLFWDFEAMNSQI